MQIEEVKQVLESKLEGCDVYPDGEGCSFQVTVVGDIFEGLRPVKKQQMVYQCLADKIADGSIHALTIKTYTRAQWAELQK
ncbi:MAG: BolA family protein [Amphritea sp.]